MDNIHIVVTDDHKLFRKGMSALLSDFEFVGDINEAGNGKELLAMLETMSTLPHIVLLDVNMPEMDGLETTRHLRKKFPEIKILILSMEDDAQLVSYLVSEGVNGYLLKNAEPDELELALKMVIKNDFYFSGHLTGAVIKNVNAENVGADSVKSEFTERELEVLRLICQEYTAAEIGERMLISPRTVEGFKRKLMEKTGTRNVAGLVIFAIKHELVKI